MTRPIIAGPSPEEQHKVLSAAGVSFTVSMAAAHAYTVTNYATPHLQAAARYSRNVADIEAAHPESELGNFWNEIQHHASACVMLAVASLESLANEALFELRDAIATLPSLLTTKIDRLPLREKFDLILEVKGRPKTQWDSGTPQALIEVMDLRDAIVHFKPERSGEHGAHLKLSNRLKHRFAPSRYFPTSESVFPRRWCCHACTKWVVETCFKFGVEFEAASGVMQKFSGKAFQGGINP